MVSSNKNNMVENSWQYKFNSPIVRVWRWDGMKLGEVNLFDTKNMPGLVTTNSILPSIYVGMDKKQVETDIFLDFFLLIQLFILALYSRIPPNAKSFARTPQH